MESADDEEGVPLTVIRESNILLSFYHANIIDVSEVRHGSPTTALYTIALVFVESITLVFTIFSG